MERWVSWDDNDLDTFRANAKRVSELGLDGISIHTLAEPTLCQIEFPDDTYTQYTIHGMTLFKLVEAGVFSNIYPAEHIKKNFDLIKKKCQIISEAGIKAKLHLMIPILMSSEFYKKYPHLKGPRVDHPARSKHAYRP